MPDFLVVGAKRGGTTSLWEYLKEHPAALPLFPRPEKVKGTYYFDERFDRGERWYRSHFPTVSTRVRARRRLGSTPVAGEASPYYLYHPLAPRRAHALLPDAKIIVLLRDPVERAFSHWKERRDQTETLSFADALDAEESRCAGEEERILADPSYLSVAHRHQSYVGQGRYLAMLERWFDVYPRRQILVGISEEFYASPQRFFDAVTDHLGIDRHHLEAPKIYNADRSAEMDGALRRHLVEEFRAEVAALEALLGRRLPWLSTCDAS